MAWLNELKRKPPQNGKADTYYQIQWRPDPNDREKISSKAIGFVNAADAKSALRAVVDLASRRLDTTPPSRPQPQAPWTHPRF